MIVKVVISGSVLAHRAQKKVLKVARKKRGFVGQRSQVVWL